MSSDNVMLQYTVFFLSAKTTQQRLLCCVFNLQSLVQTYYQHKTVGNDNAPVGVYQSSCSTLVPVSTGMDNHLKVSKPSWHIISHPDQLSLAIPPWAGTMNTSQSWGIKDTMRCTSPHLWSCSVSWCLWPTATETVTSTTQ